MMMCCCETRTATTWLTLVADCLQGEIPDEEFRSYFDQFGDIEDCVVRPLRIKLWSKASCASVWRAADLGRHVA